MYLPWRMEGRKGRKRGRERRRRDRSAPLSVSFDSQKIFLRKDFGNIKRAINAFFLRDISNVNPWEIILKFTKNEFNFQRRDILVHFTKWKIVLKTIYYHKNVPKNSVNLLKLREWKYFISKMNNDFSLNNELNKNRVRFLIFNIIVQV